ncbi:expressed unknown protein [Seminavis robusta]|uniref:Uncharacterized protein n=1 Tax=Seminavis robusta TaxID=568900 RepID=A0A9N8DMH6_9STRA|nr:expressed unknown protein [Seminavis robusta]|eukprot:Sro241_g096410.1 n/a (450) ;mRNA; f:57102-58525
MAPTDDEKTPAPAAGAFVFRQHMPVDARPLSPMDHMYFDNAFAPLNCIVQFESWWFNNDAKIGDAFQRVLQTSPILQTTVHGEGENACFKTMPEDDPTLPRVQIHDVDTAQKVLSYARQVRQEEQDRLSKGGMEARRKSLRFALFVIKFIAYTLVPQFLWFLVDRKSYSDVPHFDEMMLKQELPQLEGVDLKEMAQKSPKYSSKSFRFQDFDLFHPDAMSQLHGFQQVLVKVPKSRMDTCRKQLRQRNASISTAFQALAVKTTTVILDRLHLNQEGLDILSSIGVDIRPLVPWGDARDSAQFPVIGNYTSAFFIPVAHQKALTEPLEQLAQSIQDQVTQLRDDPRVRMEVLAYSDGNASVPFWCGISSILTPDSGRGGHNMFVESYIDFGPAPHIWFYVVTWGNETIITADIYLPIPQEGMGDAQLKQDIRKAAQDSALEDILSGGLLA